MSLLRDVDPRGPKTLNWRETSGELMQPILFLIALLPLIEPFITIVSSFLSQNLFRSIAIGTFILLSIIRFFFYIDESLIVFNKRIESPTVFVLLNLRQMLLEISLVAISYGFSTFGENISAP